MVKKVILAAILSISGIVGAYAQENSVWRLPEVNKKDVQKDYSEKQTGFWIAAEAGAAYSCRLFHSNFGYTEIDVTGGWRFNEYLRAGIGLGGRYYFDNDAVRKDHSAWGMPIYVNVRGNMIPTQYRDIVPYYSVDLGGTVRDGFMFRPSVGLRFGRERNAFILSLGYVGQHLKTYSIENPEKGKGKFVSFVSLRLGYEF